MTSDVAVGLLKVALYIGATTMAPILLTGLAIGITVGAIQAATQVNEPTLTFVPKAMGVGALGAWLFPWALDRMVSIFHAMAVAMEQVVLK
jgi:flagellar biosynthetic protein FliQ